MVYGDHSFLPTNYHFMIYKKCYIGAEIQQISGSLNYPFWEIRKTWCTCMVNFWWNFLVKHCVPCLGLVFIHHEATKLTSCELTYPIPAGIFLESMIFQKLPVWWGCVIVPYCLKPIVIYIYRWSSYNPYKWPFNKGLSLRAVWVPPLPNLFSQERRQRRLQRKASHRRHRRRRRHRRHRRHRGSLRLSVRWDRWIVKGLAFQIGSFSPKSPFLTVFFQDFTLFLLICIWV